MNKPKADRTVIRDKVVTITLSATEREQLEEEAQALGLTISAYGRMAILKQMR